MGGDHTIGGGGGIDAATRHHIYIVADQCICSSPRQKMARRILSLQRCWAPRTRNSHTPRPLYHMLSCFRALIVVVWLSEKSARSNCASQALASLGAAGPLSSHRWTFCPLLWESETQQPAPLKCARWYAVLQVHVHATVYTWNCMSTCECRCKCKRKCRFLGVHANVDTQMCLYMCTYTCKFQINCTHKCKHTCSGDCECTCSCIRTSTSTCRYSCTCTFRCKCRCQVNISMQLHTYL